MLRAAQLTMFLLVSVWVVAQAPVPGTFSTAPVQPNNGLVLTTPSMSLGNGISPTVVTNQSSVVVEAPTSTVVLSSPIGSEAMAASGGESNVGGTGSTSAYAGPSSGVAFGVASDNRSLGEIAASLRHRPPMNGRVYTNEDIKQLNANAQNAGSDQQEVAQASQGTQQAPPQPPHQYSVPVGSQPPSNVVPNEEPAQAGRPSRDVRRNPFAPKVRETTPNESEAGQMAAPSQMPKSSSLLPLLGALGGAMFAAGLIYRSLRE